MSMPRISAALAPASSAVRAGLTPPALPRPPVLTCALTTTRREPRSNMSWAARRACSGVVARAPGGTGTPCRSNRSLAWYSYRSMRSSFRVVIPMAGRPRPGRAARAGGSVGEPTQPRPARARTRRAGRDQGPAGAARAGRTARPRAHDSEPTYEDYSAGGDAGAGCGAGREAAGGFMAAFSCLDHLCSVGPPGSRNTVVQPHLSGPSRSAASRHARRRPTMRAI